MWSLVEIESYQVDLVSVSDTYLVFTGLLAPGTLSKWPLGCHLLKQAVDCLAHGDNSVILGYQVKLSNMVGNSIEYIQSRDIGSRQSD